MLGEVTRFIELVCLFVLIEDALSMNGGDSGGDNYKPSGDYHDITRYMKEMDSSLTRDRKKGRCSLFNVYTALPVSQ